MFVPVVDCNHKPLMPTTPSRARRWIKRGEATPFWDRGIFCVRLNREPSDIKTQPIAVGVDPGSKKEGLTVKSASHTYLNINADAVTFVKEAKEQQIVSRHNRRYHNTPCRQCRSHRTRDGKATSVMARWQWKLRLINWIRRVFPVSHVVVENVSAESRKNCRKWNLLFSPLQTCKNWFYGEIRKFAMLRTFEGYDTKRMRIDLGLKKTSKKKDNVFEAHCVDSWVLANAEVGGHDSPGNTDVLCVTPLRLHRRQLHFRQPSKSGERSPYGGTRSLGFKRGSIVRHSKRGVTYVGGSSDGRISLHRMKDGKRLCQNAKASDIKFLAYSTWRTYTA